VIAFKVEVIGAKEAAAALHSKAAKLRNWTAPLTESGFLLLMRIWDRVTGKSTSPPTYSDRYVQWLLRHGEWSGKMVGILTGGLIGMSAPASGAGGDLELSEGPGYVEVGFLNPTGKVHGFLAWFKRKFGEEAIQATESDQREIGEIFDRWLAETG
jgi:hypothetical protein